MPEEGKCRRRQGKESTGVEDGEVMRGERKKGRWTWKKRLTWRRAREGEIGACKSTVKAPQLE